MMSEILALMEQSDVHRDWTVSDIQRLIKPAINLGYWVESRSFGHLTGFGTYGFFSNEAFEGYKDRTRKIQPEDFNSGYNIVLIDIVAPNGTAKELTSKIRSRLVRGGYKGDYISFFRIYNGRRVGKKVML